MTVPEGICSQSRRWGTRGRLSLSPTAASGSLSPLSEGTPMDSDDGGFTPAPRVQLVCSFQISRLDGGSFFQATHQPTFFHKMLRVLNVSCLFTFFLFLILSAKYTVSRQLSGRSLLINY